MINVITPATEYPVLLFDVKTSLRVDHASDDVEITRLIAAATDDVQMMSARSLVSRTIEMILSSWPIDDICLEYPPVSSVQSITYYNDNNTLLTMPAGDYISMLDLPRPSVMLAKNAHWPDATLRPVSPIRVRYVSGYGNAAAVPARYKQLITALVAVDYAHRGEITTQGAAQRAMIMAACMQDWGWAT